MILKDCEIVSFYELTEDDKNNYDWEGSEEAMYILDPRDGQVLASLAEVMRIDDDYYDGAYSHGFYFGGLVKINDGQDTCEVKIV